MCVSSAGPSRTTARISITDFARKTWHGGGADVVELEEKSAKDRLTRTRTLKRGLHCNVGLPAMWKSLIPLVGVGVAAYRVWLARDRTASVSQTLGVALDRSQLTNVVVGALMTMVAIGPATKPSSDVEILNRSIDTRSSADSTRRGDTTQVRNAVPSSRSTRFLRLSTPAETSATTKATGNGSRIVTAALIAGF